MVWDKVVEVWLPVRLITLALTHEGLANNPKVEVFPKRTSNGNGGALRLPMMTHPKTGIRYPAFLPDGRKVRSLRDLLLELDYVESEKALAWVEAHSVRDTVSHTAPKRLGAYQYRDVSRLDDDSSASEFIRSWGSVDAAPGKTVKCPKHDDAHRSLTIYRDDKRVYCGNPECVLNGQGHGVGTFVLGTMA
jgi:hypothetical protein